MPLPEIYIRYWYSGNGFYYGFAEGNDVVFGMYGKVNGRSAPTGTG